MLDSLDFPPIVFIYYVFVCIAAGFNVPKRVLALMATTTANAIVMIMVII